MHLQQIIGGTTRLRLAVVGAPSSGKTYLLSDLVYALRAMGCKAQTLPLDYPHSGIGAFFYEISGYKTEDELNKEMLRQQGMRQTEEYACRPENHYAGIFSLPHSRHKIEIDFVNIPGEVFRGNGSSATAKDTQQRMKFFFDLRNAIVSLEKPRPGRPTPGKAFAVVTYNNPAGRAIRIIEPSDNAVTTLGLRFNPEKMASEIPADRAAKYMTRPQLQRELHLMGYKRGRKRDISGQQLLDHFTDYNPDSFLCTVKELWTIIRLQDQLDWDDMEFNRVFDFFYFLVYCQQATDIIVCDKLFLPDGSTDTSFNFDEFTKCVAQLFPRKAKHVPNVYLAFRTADMLMSESTTRYNLANMAKGLAPHERRTKVYDAFVRDLRLQLEGQRLAHASERYIDAHASSRMTMTGTTLDRHIASRLGSGVGYAFRHLYNATWPRGFFAALRRQLRGQQPPQQLERASDVLMPQVYFTATPIDLDFNIYDNDKADATQFINTSRGLRSFHLDTTRYGHEPFCFGSYQLMRDICRFNGNHITP